MPEIKAVTLDLWQTLLIDERELGRERTRFRLVGAVEALSDAGESFTEDHVREAHRACYRTCRAIREGGRDVSFEEQVRIFVGSIDDGLLDRISEETFRRIYNRYANSFFDAPPRMADGVPKMLTTLKEGGYKIGLISNTGMTPGSVFRTHLGDLGVLAHFDHLAFSDEVLYAKPSAVIFRHALDGLGCRVEETVHVGDHLLNDIVGAQELGIRTVWLEGFDTSETEVRPTATIQRIADLPDALVHMAAS